MIKAEVIIILLVIFSLYLWIKIEKSYRVKTINIDEVANLPLKEQQKLLSKEKAKLMNLIYEYKKAGYWKGLVFRYYVTDFEKRLEIEKAIKITEDNILLLENVIYKNKYYNG